jgi:uncharacterized protein YjiS (DUF1127 family)
MKPLNSIHVPARGGRTDRQPLGRWLLWHLAEIRAVTGAWRQRYRYRRELQRLIKTGPHLIDDIGLWRTHADREAAKPFWRP